jgi:tripartite ATP-independent transporter DctP family solute receptor
MFLKINKKLILLGLFICILTLSQSQSQEKKITLKFGHFAPINHPLDVGINKAAEEIKKLSNGRIIINVFPASQLGNNKELVQQVSDGSLEFVTDGPGMLANWHKPIEIFEAPFFAKDWDEMRKFLNSGAARKLYLDLESKSNLKIIGDSWYYGVRHFTTKNKPINNPDNLKGLKIRVPQSPLYIDMISSLGAIPTPMPFPEVYIALQTNLIDGQENPVGTINSGKFQEVQKYISLTGHIMNPFWIVTNTKIWNSIPKKDQDIIIKGFNVGGIMNNELTFKGEKELLEKFKSAGMNITTPNKNLFQEKMKKVYENNEDKWGKNLLSEIKK